MTDPSSPEPHPDYAHTEDAQEKRTRYELWAIVAIVLVVLVAAFAWRAATGTPPAPRAGVKPGDPTAGPPPVAAGAGVPARGADAAPPRAAP